MMEAVSTSETLGNYQIRQLSHLGGLIKLPLPPPPPHLLHPSELAWYASLCSCWCRVIGGGWKSVSFIQQRSDTNKIFLQRSINVFFVE